MHHRRSIRLPGYDYRGARAYFVTICTAQRQCLFGEVEGERVVLSPAGTIAHEEWLQTASVRQNVGLDLFVIMPNHLHGIIVLTEGGVGVWRRQTPTDDEFKAEYAKPIPGSLGTILGAYKSKTTRRVNLLLQTEGSIWQRNYWERVIRDERELNAIRQYILANPARWQDDEHHPSRNR
ncbi:MAG: transposase [Anaerolineae bacterium]|nr:transposase [Anaerolineae bacterium]